MSLQSCRRIVIKIGSSLLVNEQTNSIHLAWLESLIVDIAHLVAQKKEIIIVSSGAVALGKIALHLPHKQLTLDKRQAAAAIGQIELLRHFQQLLQAQQLQAAQVLLTLDDTEHRSRYINCKNTLQNLVAMGIIPIINENDSVATTEIRYGDNDRLAARVAQMIGADTLILLSDIDGFYSDDPRRSNTAKLIPQVDNIDEKIMHMAKQSSTHYGSGGMASKIQAAKIAVHCGCRMLITAGKPMRPLDHFIQHGIGTWFEAVSTPAKAKKNWLQHHLRVTGKIMVDAGALQALTQGSSLLPVGITHIIEPFAKGSLIAIVGADQKIIAKGLCNYASDDLQKIAGKKTGDIEDILHYKGCDAAVHRDNLVLLIAPENK